MIVLDASALVDVVLDHPKAGWILDQMAGGGVHAPAHQRAETLSALARLLRASALEPPAAREAVERTLALPQRLVIPTASHIRRAFALRDRIRVVDGLYVALADELGCPLITTDRRLAAADAPCEVRTPPDDPGPVPPPRAEVS